jgi:hypothetical protein
VPRLRLTAVLLSAAACSRTLEAPAPELSAIVNQADPSAASAVVCNAQGDALHGWPVDLMGNHFVALPRDTLTDPTGVDLPTVALDGVGASAAMPRSRTFYVDHQHLTVDFPTADTSSYALKLPPGSYALSVTNPGAAAVNRADALRVVNAPSLQTVREPTAAGLIDPVVCADADGALTLTGGDFRTDVPLRVTIGGKALPAPLSAKPTSLTVTVPANTFSQAEASAAGTPYTVQVASPEGCVAPYGAAARGFGITDVLVASKPTIAALQAQGAAGLGAPTICQNAASATLVITGTSLWTISGRAPVVDLIAGATRVSADQVTVAPAGPSETFSGTTVTAHFTLPANLPAGPATVRLTNANGCSADAAALLNAQVALCPVLGALALTPRFGWDQQNQPVTLTNQFTQPATQPFSAGAPQAFLIAPVKGTPGNQRIPLRRVAFLDGSTVTAVVPTCSGLAPTLSNADCTSGIQAGGPYDLEVQDPSGATGRIAAAFTVVANQPPAFAAGPSALNPASITVGGGTVRVSGAHFDTPGGTHSTVYIGTQVTGGVEFCLAPAAGTTSDTVLDVAVPATFADASKCYVEGPTGSRAAAGSGFALGAGLYLVRVQHGGDVAFADYSGLIVVGSAYNPVAKGVASSTLVTARGSHGLAVATDDLGNAFLYAAGGSANGASELASVEVAPIGPFGDLGGDCTGAGCKFRALDRTPLPTARAGLSLVARAVPNDTTYLFVLGGRSGTTASAEVLRAQVLRNADAPVIASAQAAAGALAAGTYYYRVSALRPAGDAKNPGGETLASDEQPVTLGAAGGVALGWACSTAQKYRVYRTASANAVAGTEVLLTELAATPSCAGGEQFTDDGSLTAGAEKPLPAGALGKWAAAAQGVPQLGAARFDAAARVVGDTIFIVGGCSAGTGTTVVCANGKDLADMEAATFASAADVAPGAFSGAGTAVLQQARSRHALAVADASGAPISNGKSYLLAFGGSSSAATISGSNSAEVFLVGGTAFQAVSGAPNNVGVGGWAEVQAGQAFFEATDGHSANPKSSALCGGGSGCASISAASDFHFNFNSGFPAYTAGGTRFLAGEQLFRAFIYVAGGFAADNSFTPAASVDRIVY